MLIFMSFNYKTVTQYSVHRKRTIYGKPYSHINMGIWLAVNRSLTVGAHRVGAFVVSALKAGALIMGALMMGALIYWRAHSGRAHDGTLMMGALMLARTRRALS